MKTSLTSHNEINLLSVSDIHLGHRRTSTSYIVDNLYSEINNNPVLNKINIIFIAGDIFDRLLTLPSDDISPIMRWAHSLLRVCSEKNISLRILEGTPSHDWGQSELFNTLAANISNLDFKYINILCIDKIEKYDLDVLYIPDEWTSSTATTLKQVKTLMKSNGLDKVDLAIMHGMFDYQVPQNKNEDAKHISEEYLSMVRHYIFIGHVHKFSFFDRIIAQGSFDRLNQGEEEPKGFVIASIKGEVDSYQFIENKNAKIYKTIDIKTNSDKEISRVRKILDKLPKDSYVRIRLKTDSDLINQVNEIKKEYIFLNMDKQIKDEETTDSIVEVINHEYEVLTITPENIKALLKEKLISMNAVEQTDNVFNVVESFLNDQSLI